MSKTSRHAKGSQFAKPTLLDPRKIQNFILSACQLVPFSLSGWLVIEYHPPMIGFYGGILIGVSASVSILLRRQSKRFAEQLFLAIKMAMNLVLKLTDTSHNLDQKAEPPIIAEFLAGLCVKRRCRNGVLQNLEEDFEKKPCGWHVRKASAQEILGGRVELDWAAAMGGGEAHRDHRTLR